jgi:hypothetical protein
MSAPGQIVKTYDYRSASGALLFQVCRYDPKDFRQRRPDGNGGWLWNLDGVSRFLYRLPELLAADPAAWVFVVEGEKDADAVAALGLVATCSPGGAGNWKRLAGDSALHGRRVCILAHKDAAGRAHAQDVAQWLRGKADDVRILELPDVGDVHVKDASDWIEAQDAREPQDLAAALVEMAETAMPWTPPLAEAAAKSAATAVVPTFLTVAELLRTYPVQREPVIDGLIRRGEVGNVISGPKLYKSWLLMQLALCIVLGRDFLGFLTKRGRVLLLDYELHAATLAKRLYLMMTAMGVTADEIGDRLVIEPLRGRRLDVHALGDYFAAIPARTFDCVIVDPLYRTFPDDLDENSNANLASLYATLQRYAEALDAALIVVHHLSKGDQSFKSVTDLGSGGGSQSRAADAHLAIRPHAQEGVGVLSGVLRSWPPFDAYCIKRDFPLWIEARDLDPLDLRRPQPRRAKALTEPAEPPPPAWTVERFAAEILTDTPQTRAAVLDSAIRAGVPNVHQATRLLELAEATDKAFRWRMPKDKRTYFAAQRQPTLTGETP